MNNENKVIETNVDEVFEVEPIEDKEIEISLYDKIKYYEASMNKINDSYESICNNFLIIANELKKIKKYKLYLLDDYTSIYDFAKDKFNIGSTTCKNLLMIIDKYCIEKSIDDEYSFSSNYIWSNSYQLDPKFKSYTYSQLIELKTLSNEEIKDISPSMSVREIKAFKIRNKLKEENKLLFEKNKNIIERIKNLLKTVSWNNYTIELNFINEIEKEESFSFISVYLLKFIPLFSINNSFNYYFRFVISNNDMSINLYENQYDSNPKYIFDCKSNNFFQLFENNIHKIIKNNCIQVDVVNNKINNNSLKSYELDVDLLKFYSYNDLIKIYENYKYMIDNVDDFLKFFKNFDKDNKVFIFISNKYYSLPNYILSDSLCFDFEDFSIQNYKLIDTEKRYEFSISYDFYSFVEDFVLPYLFSLSNKDKLDFVNRLINKKIEII